MATESSSQAWLAMLIISAIGRPKLEDQDSCAIQRDPGFIKIRKKGESRKKEKEEGMMGGRK